MRFQILDNDSDPDGDALTISSIEPPSDGRLTGPDALSGIFTYVPDADWNGTETLRYVIADGRGGEATAQVVITVRPVNDQPDAADDTVNAAGGEWAIVSLRPLVRDIDGDELSFSVDQPDHGEIVDNGDGTVSYRVGRGFSGTAQFRYTVADGSGGFASAVVRLVVRGATKDAVGITGLSLDIALDENGTLATHDGTGLAGPPGLALIFGNLFDTFDLLRLPLLVLLLAFGASLLFGLSRVFVWGTGPVYLAPIAPGRSHAVLVAAGHTLPVRRNPGKQHEVIAEIEAAARDLRTTGRRAQVRTALWIEVETPNGDGWVLSKYLTESVSLGRFAMDGKPEELMEQLVALLAEGSSLEPVTSDRGLHVAHFAAPEHIDAGDLAGLASDRSVWAWWSRSGSIPEVEGSFAEVISAPLIAAVKRYEAGARCRSSRRGSR